MFPGHAIAAAQAHGVAEYPREAVGIIVDSSYVPLRNVSPWPEKQFDVDPSDYRPYLGRIEALIHSHPDDWPVPSERDMAQQIAMDVPWGIYNVAKATSPTADPQITHSKVAWFGRQISKGPLVSSPTVPARWFMHGHTDCLNLIRDGHAIQGIELPDTPRDWEWWLEREAPDGSVLKAQNFYRDLFAPYGFDRIDGPAPWSVFMVPMGQHENGQPIMTPNHAGIYLGNGLILHHLTRKAPIDLSRIAARQPLSRWVPFFNAPPIWVRHRDLPMKGLRAI